MVGWLGPCSAYDCSLSPTKEDTLLLATSDFDSPAVKAASERSLTVAHEAIFDRAATGLAMKQVVLRATVTDQCHQHESGKFCLDRGGDLIPIRVYPKNS